MTARDQLYTWLAANMPELHAELADMTPAASRARLNALTGARITSCDSTEDGCRVHLAALQDLTGQY